MWGRVVNMSSVGGQLSLPGGSAYHASKYAVEALSDVVRFDVAPLGVDVILSSPV
jgi:NADP-dependent 3-hydroxy acid dehydrogenase YdfG